jgi:hypothetical protein
MANRKVIALREPLQKVVVNFCLWHDSVVGDFATLLQTERGVVLAAYRQWSKNRLHIILRIALILILIGLCVNVVGNVLGATPFERIAMTLVCVVQILCVIRLLAK